MRGCLSSETNFTASSREPGTTGSGRIIAISSFVERCMPYASACTRGEIMRANRFVFDTCTRGANSPLNNPAEAPAIEKQHILKTYYECTHSELRRTLQRTSITSDLIAAPPCRASP